MFRRLVLLAGAMLLVCSAPSYGQDGVAGPLFGAGVHAYFTGQYDEAFKLFDEALQAGNRDPQIYYFRGLTYARLGRGEEAELDFAKGAELETADIERLTSVSKAIERIQGADRIRIEQYRAKARVAAYQKADKLRKARYEELRREETRVLEQQSRAVPPAPAAGMPVVPDVGFGEPATSTPAAAPQPTAPKAPANAAAVDPFGDAPAKPAVKATGSGVAAPGAAGGDPFAPSPVADRSVTSKQAIGIKVDSSAAPSATKAAPKAAAATDADPFAPSADVKQPAVKKAAVDDSDPFAAPAGDAKPATKKAPATDDSDPFAAPADDKKPAAKKAATTKAADDSDPFGAEPAPAKSSAKKAPIRSSTKTGAKASKKVEADSDPFAPPK